MDTVDVDDVDLKSEVTSILTDLLLGVGESTSKEQMSAFRNGFTTFGTMDAEDSFLLVMSIPFLIFESVRSHYTQNWPKDWKLKELLCCLYSPVSITPDEIIDRLRFIPAVTQTYVIADLEHAWQAALKRYLRGIGTPWMIRAITPELENEKHPSYRSSLLLQAICGFTRTGDCPITFAFQNHLHVQAPRRGRHAVCDKLSLPIENVC